MKTKISIISFLISLLLPTAAFAQTPAVTGTVGAATTVKQSIAEQRQEVKATITENRTTDLKTRADNEIQRRITALSDLVTRISNFKRLSADQKTTFSNSIQAEITNLNSLKAKIDADTDTTTLKTDVKSIVADYRVFAVYIPQIRILETSDRILTLADEMTTYATNLQTRITQAQGSGQNVTTLTTALTDMQNKIKDAQTLANGVVTSVETLTPAGYPGNKTALQSAKTSLMTAFSDLKTARTDGQSIMQGLHSLGLAKSSSLKTGLTPTQSANSTEGGIIPTATLAPTQPATP